MIPPNLVETLVVFSLQKSEKIAQSPFSDSNFLPGTIRMTFNSFGGSPLSFTFLGLSLPFLPPDSGGDVLLGERYFLFLPPFILPVALRKSSLTDLRPLPPPQP